MKKLTSLLVAAVVAVGAAELCLYTVGEREYALVFALGELKDVKSEPGLYVKLPAPLQNIVYLDKRILTLDAPNADLVQTSEKKNLLIDSFVRWRIADPRKYWVSFIGNERAAEDRVAALLRDVLNQTANRRTVNEITSREREKAMNEIQKGLQARVQDIGIDIVDVRLKRVDFTPEISESVYRRMEAERKREAREERSKLGSRRKPWPVPKPPLNSVLMSIWQQVVVRLRKSRVRGTLRPMPFMPKPSTAIPSLRSSIAISKLTNRVSASRPI